MIQTAVEIAKTEVFLDKKRIIWYEGTDILSNEIKRVKREYVPASIVNSCGSHHIWGNIG